MAPVSTAATALARSSGPTTATASATPCGAAPSTSTSDSTRRPRRTRPSSARPSSARRSHETVGTWSAGGGHPLPVEATRRHRARGRSPTDAPDRALVGKTVTLSVTGTKAGFAPVTTSASVVVSGPSLKTHTPVVLGAAKVGGTLVALAVWGPLPVKLSYQWLADAAGPIHWRDGSDLHPARRSWARPSRSP